jgi:hypothetical protein
MIRDSVSRSFRAETPAKRMVGTAP